MEEKEVSRKSRESVAVFIDNLIRASAKTLIRFGSSAREFGDVGRWSFVKAFYSTPDLWVEGRPTLQKAAIKTGLPRHKVKTLSALPAPHHALFSYRQNLAYRVVEGWVNDSAFHLDGVPAPLPITSRSEPCFRKLVTKYGSNITWGPVLKDLESVGCVEQKDGLVVLINQTYGMHFLNEDKLAIAGHMLRHLAETTYHNLTHSDSKARRLQRFWRQTHIPVDRVVEAKRLATEIAVDAGRRIDRELARIAAESNSVDKERVEIGIGMYLYEDRTDTDVGELKDDLKQRSDL